MNDQRSHDGSLAAFPRGVGGLLLVSLAAMVCTARAADPALPRLRVSDNGRFLVTSDGKPFFWLGDTAWHMFGKSVRDEAANQPSASLYFSNRAAKGFTVIQSVIVRTPQDGSMANAYGFEPFENGDLVYGAHIPWYDALDAPGAFQMGHLRRLMESLPDPLDRIPDQSLLAGQPGTGTRHIAVTRDARGRYALAYSPSGNPFPLRLDGLAGERLRAAWFDSREGTCRVFSEIACSGTREFTPPTEGEGHDWVLVLNDASRNFPLPSPEGKP